MEERMKGKDEEIDRLKSERVCKCKDLFDSFVTVGNMVFSGSTLMYLDETGNQQTVTSLADSVENCAVSSEPTLDTSVSTLDSSLVSSTPVMEASSNISISDNLSRVIVEPLLSNTSLLSKQQVNTSVHTLDELPESLRDSLRAFYGPKSPAVTNEKLTDLQRAYVKYIRSRPENLRLSPSVLARKCLNMGISDRIWAPSFRPPGVQDFYKYLHQRMRNLQTQERVCKLHTLANTQKARLEEALEPKAKKAKVSD